jgi:ABC-type multidrug transport system ATPase subunit/peptidoglycan/LPS O-acetylase OafA/YrhL
MSSQERLHALDAVRAFALLAGIVLHATMSFFLPIPAQDVSRSATLGMLFSLIHPWRMTTFFLIAGLFARLLIDKRGARGFVADRAKRIVAPLIVGWLAFAPLTIVLLIWGVSRSADPAIAAMISNPPVQPAGAFPLTHLWFLYYLVIFYVLLLGVIAVFSKVDAKGRISGMVDKVVRPLLGSYFAPFVLGLPLFAVLGFDQRIVLMGGIPTPDSSLIPQLPALAGFGTAFAVGWFVHRQIDLLGEWRQRWFGNLAIAVALFVVYHTVPGIKPNTTAGWLGDSAEWATSAYAACYIASIWYWSFGLIGCALKLCATESVWRRYLADASYWMYLAHLPVVFFLAAALANVPLHWAIKFPLILAITLGVLLATYRFFVRPTWIGEILNGRKYPRTPRGPLEPDSSPSAKRKLRTLTPSASGDHGTSPSLAQQPGIAAGPAARTDAEPLAELVGARKSYGETVALRGVDLDVRRGEVLAVLGPNGAGKSTAISLWLGLLQADGGEVHLMSRSPLDVEARREVGLMLQEVVLPPTLRVSELVALTASFYPSPFDVRETLALTGTAELSDKYCGKLSAGQKRQVQFALAICGRPRLLFLDEPTVGLDVQARETMWSTIRKLIAHGCSIVLTTHYLEEAEALADRVAVLARGELIALGTVDEVRSIVSRKKIMCSSALPIAAVRAWPDVVDASGDERRMHITTADAEAVVRRLLASDQNLRNLEIKQAGLAEAFAELTKEAA